MARDRRIGIVRANGCGHRTRATWRGTGPGVGGPGPGGRDEDHLPVDKSGVGNGLASDKKRLICTLAYLHRLADSSPCPITPDLGGRR